MLAPILVLAILAGGQPSPSPVPSAPPLKEIVHVRASAFCTDFAKHANGAIDSATRNDVALGSLITTLRAKDFDANVIAHRNHVDQLRQIADAITKDWKDGEREVDALRKLADKATDPDEKKELKAGADSLGGALWRQRKIARDLDGFVAYIYARDMATNDESQTQSNMAVFGTADPKDTIRSVAPQMFSNPGLANETDLLPTATQATKAAADFESHLPDIVHDEISAAVHVETVSNGC